LLQRERERERDEGREKERERERERRHSSREQRVRESRDVGEHVGNALGGYIGDTSLLPSATAREATWQTRRSRTAGIYTIHAYIYIHNINVYTYTCIYIYMYIYTYT
jgi:hypothetical protein